MVKINLLLSLCRAHLPPATIAPMRCLVFSLLCIAFLLPVSVMAAQPLLFRDQAKGARETSVIEFLQAQKRMTPDLPYKIARVDLNGDGLEEWIVSQQMTACQASASCPVSVVGLTDNEPVLLAALNARKVGIADEKSYGVRKLLVYTDQSNDFSFKSYAWNPAAREFEPE